MSKSLILEVLCAPLVPGVRPHFDSMTRKTVTTIVVVAILCLSAVWLVGGILAAPSNHHVGDIPPDLRGQSVEIASQSGSVLRGWWLPGRGEKGTVILLHGVRSSRLSMLGRARFLSRAGYGALLFDFQAHGESPGRYVTFGHFESRDAQAAVDLIRRNNPREKVGLIGVSMGGAACLLASPALEANAMVLESVYPTIEEAIADRIALRVGEWGGMLAPLLALQLVPRLGVRPEDLRPIEKVGGSAVPKFFIFGAEDRHTRPEESLRLVAAAAAPKETWAVSGAGHIDLHAYGRAEYEIKVLEFLDKYMR